MALHLAQRGVGVIGTYYSHGNEACALGTAFIAEGFL